MPSPAATVPVRVLSWNLERCEPRRRERQQRALDRLDYDITAISEARVAFPHEDQAAAAGPLGGWLDDDERKVVAWSRWGWEAIELTPQGARDSHMVIGITRTPAGPLRVVAATIPYINGHKPYGNYQSSLRESVEARLNERDN